MAIAEGKTFQFEAPEKIRTDYLEAFEYPGKRQLVTYSTKEFSCVCPFSGLPDFGELIIQYVPKGLCVELKSLKYYLVSYRSIGIYQEAATDRLHTDLAQLLSPHYLKITTIYNTRGGIDATCSIETGSIE